MSRTALRPSSRDHRDQPTYWFATLEIARERQDHDAAAEAIRELRRLGIRVRYSQPEPRQGVGRE